MLFLLKSAFWLLIVYSCMNWPDHERPAAMARTAAREFAVKAQAKAVATASAHCARNLTSCLDLAGRGATATQSASFDGKTAPRKAGN